MLFVAAQVTVCPVIQFFMAAIETLSCHSMEMTDVTLSALNMFYIVRLQYVSSMTLAQDAKLDLWGVFLHWKEGE